MRQASGFCEGSHDCVSSVKTLGYFIWWGPSWCIIGLHSESQNSQNHNSNFLVDFSGTIHVTSVRANPNYQYHTSLVGTVLIVGPTNADTVGNHRALCADATSPMWSLANSSADMRALRFNLGKARTRPTALNTDIMFVYKLLSSWILSSFFVCQSTL